VEEKAGNTSKLLPRVVEYPYSYQNIAAKWDRTAGIPIEKYSCNKSTVCKYTSQHEDLAEEYQSFKKIIYDLFSPFF